MITNTCCAVRLCECRFYWREIKFVSPYGFQFCNTKKKQNVNFIYFQMPFLLTYIQYNAHKQKQVGLSAWWQQHGACCYDNFASWLSTVATWSRTAGSKSTQWRRRTMLEYSMARFGDACQSRAALWFPCGREVSLSVPNCRWQSWHTSSTTGRWISYCW